MKKIIAMIGTAVILSAVIALVALPLGASAASAGGTGLTAAVVATSGQTISGNISATGYDVGIYIGPGVHNVLVKGANVTGANNEGILVQDASDIVIEDSTISGNGVNTNPGIMENKAIMLVGTTNSVVEDNIVEDNIHGGIGVEADSPFFDPGAPIPTATAPMAGTGNVITGNLVQDNGFDCGIVVAPNTPGGVVSDNVVAKNTVTITTAGVGGIVVGAGIFPATAATDNIILRNVVNGGLLAGIVLHSWAPGGVVSGTHIIGNVLSNNGIGEPGDPNDPQVPTGIVIVAEVGVPPMPGGPTLPLPVLTGTQVLSNTVSNDVYGVWVCNATATHIAHLTTNSVGNDTFTCP